MKSDTTEFQKKEQACAEVHKLAWKLSELTNPLLDWDAKEICKVCIQLQQALAGHHPIRTIS